MMWYIILSEESVWGAAISAIATGIISISVSIISTIISIWTARKERLNFYSSTVSKERVAWINQTRDIASKLIAFCSMHSEDVLVSEDVFRFEELRSALVLRLTPKAYINEKQQYLETDGKLVELLEKEYSVIRDSRYQIREIVVMICKTEWNRIKAEAGGNNDVEKKIEEYDQSVKKRGYNK